MHHVGQQLLPGLLALEQELISPEAFREWGHHRDSSLD